MRTAARALGLLAGAALVALSVPFAVTHLRAAIYPSLELGDFAVATDTLAASASEADTGFGRLAEERAPESEPPMRAKSGRRSEIGPSRCPALWFPPARACRCGSGARSS